MVTKRSIGVAILLTIVTCGLYGIYWMYALTEDVRVLSGDESFSGMKSILLTLVTCGIYTWFWMYLLGRNIAKAQHAKGALVKDNALLYVILSIFGLGIINYCIAQSDVNELAETENV